MAIVVEGVASSQPSGSGASSTSHVVTLPASISVGDLIVIWFGSRPDFTFSDTAGFTLVGSIANGSGLEGGWLYKAATGGETSVTFTTTTSIKSAATAYRISGAEAPATQAPEAPAGATGSSTAPDPPSITPTNGPKDFLFLAAFVQRQDLLATAAPASYTDLLTQANAGGTVGGRVNIATARRFLNVSTEDPGTFTAGQSDIWAASILAVHPSSGTTPVGQERQALWTTLDAVGDPLDTLWNVRDAVGDPLETIWHLRDAVAQTRQVLWDVVVAVGRPTQTVWNVSALVGQSRQALWNVRSAAARPLSVQWNNLVPVAVTRQALWQLATSVGRTVQGVWSLRVSVGREVQTLWNVNSFVAVGRAVKFVWNILKSSEYGLTAHEFLAHRASHKTAVARRALGQRARRQMLRRRRGGH